MLQDLLEQLPPGIVAYGILVPILSLGLILYAVLIRPMLAKRKKLQAEAQTASTTPVVAKQTPIAPVVKAQSALLPDDDMPDIGLLLTQSEKPTAPVAAPSRPTGPRQLGEAEVVLITGQTVRAREELALLRDPVDGRLIVQMPGVTYKSFGSAPAAKEQFTRLMTELAKSLNLPDTAPAPTIAPPPVPSTPTPPEPVAAAPVAPPTPEVILPPAPLPPLTTSTMSAIPPIEIDKESRLPGDLPRYSNMRGAEFKGRGFLGRPKFEFERIPDLNLAESIETYLQFRLNQTPGYGGKPWHVHSALNGALQIEVDGKFFDSVNDITDVNARSFIQAAIQEWQERQ